MTLPELPNGEVKEEVDRVANWRQPKKGGVSPTEVKRELQEVMERYVGSSRHENGLKRALAKIEELRDDCETRLEVVDIPVYNNSWREAIEVVNMFSLAEIVTTSALMRQESRGHHYRADYPESDDSWTKHTITAFQGGKGFYSTAPVIRLNHELGV